MLVISAKSGALCPDPASLTRRKRECTALGKAGFEEMILAVGIGALFDRGRDIAVFLEVSGGIDADLVGHPAFVEACLRKMFAGRADLAFGKVYEKYTF